VRVAGSSPVIRSPPSGAFLPRTGRRSPAPSGGRLREGRHGGVAEWFRQGSAKPFTPVQFRAPPPPGRSGTTHRRMIGRHGRVAQRESASLTRKKSQVQSLSRPPGIAAAQAGSEDAASWFSRLAPGRRAANGQQTDEPAGRPCATGAADAEDCWAHGSHGWGDSTSSPPPQAPPGGGCASRLTCDSLLPAATVGARCLP
jgi:hypothetical protein